MLLPSWQEKVKIFQGEAKNQRRKQEGQIAENKDTLYKKHIVTNTYTYPIHTYLETFEMVGVFNPTLLFTRDISKKGDENTFKLAICWK